MTIYVLIEKVRVSAKQAKRVTRNKVEKHKKFLETCQEDLMPIDACKLTDGTFTIDGNGRHRYFAYLELGYREVPIFLKD